MHMLQETLITFPVLNLDATSSKTLSFFLSTVIEWNNLDPALPKSKRFVNLKNSILKFIRPSTSNVFNCNHYKGKKVLDLSRGCA